MSEKFKIFIACSSNAKVYSDELIKALESKSKKDRAGRYQLEPWYRQINHGDTIIGFLLKKAKEVDAAIVLFTKDDKIVQLRGKDLDEKYSESVPRDNTVFELGLFLGALKCDVHRVAIVDSGVTSPADLGGIIYLPLDECPEHGSQGFLYPERCAECDKSVKSLKKAAYDIHEKWKSKKTIERGVPLDSLISFAELEKREISDSEIEMVFVHSARPLEKKYRFATRVMQNIRGGMTYQYFFKYSDNKKEKKVYEDIARLLRNLIYQDKEGKYNLNDWLEYNRRDKGRDNERDNKKKKEDLEKMDEELFNINLESLQKMLYINFIEEKKITNEIFCLHKINTMGDSTEDCYIRLDTFERNPDKIYFVQIENSKKNRFLEHFNKESSENRIISKGALDEVDFGALDEVGFENIKEIMEEKFKYYFPQKFVERLMFACFENEKYFEKRTISR